MVQVALTIFIFVVTLTKAAPAFPVITIALVPVRLSLMNRIWRREVLRFAAHGHTKKAPQKMTRTSQLVLFGMMTRAYADLTGRMVWKWVSSSETDCGSKHTEAGRWWGSTRSDSTTCNWSS